MLLPQLADSVATGASPGILVTMPVCCAIPSENCFVSHIVRHTKLHFLAFILSVAEALDNLCTCHVTCVSLRHPTQAIPKHLCIMFCLCRAHKLAASDDTTLNHIRNIYHMHRRMDETGKRQFKAEVKSACDPRHFKRSNRESLAFSMNSWVPRQGLSLPSHTI